MKNKLINDINDYISYLNGGGLYVTVHGRGISGLLEHNVHRNPFCALVKTCDAAWQKCIACQQRLFREHEKEIFFGMCHAGVEEYVFFVNDKTFVSVSGYGIAADRAAKRIKRISEDFFIEKDELFRVYHNSLKHSPENLKELTIIIKPLCHMLNLLQLLLADIPESEGGGDMFESLLAFVQTNFMQDISVRDISQACSCSESTVSHLFKQNMGVSVKKYISTLRINQAKKLLETSTLPVSTIALMCGFSNINYFPTAFKKSVGVNPTQYREK